MNPEPGFARLADALTRHAKHLVQTRATARRAGDARWRNPRLLWPNFGDR